MSWNSERCVDGVVKHQCGPNSDRGDANGGAGGGESTGVPWEDTWVVRVGLGVVPLYALVTPTRVVLAFEGHGDGLLTLIPLTVRTRLGGRPLCLPTTLRSTAMTMGRMTAPTRAPMTLDRNDDASNANVRDRISELTPSPPSPPS